MDESFVLAKDLARSDMVLRIIGRCDRSKNGVNWKTAIGDYNVVNVRATCEVGVKAHRDKGLAQA